MEAIVHAEYKKLRENIPFVYNNCLYYVSL